MGKLRRGIDERPNNRGQPLTPLLEGVLVRDLEEKLRVSEAKVEDLERCLVDEIAERNEHARIIMQLEQEKAEIERKNTQLEQQLKEFIAWHYQCQAWTSSRSDAATRIAVVATRDAMATRLAALEIENSARSPLRWIEEP